jgi:hypothetical protein
MHPGLRQSILQEQIQNLMAPVPQWIETRQHLLQIKDWKAKLGVGPNYQIPVPGKHSYHQVKCLACQQNLGIPGFRTSGISGYVPKTSLQAVVLPCGHMLCVEDYEKWKAECTSSGEVSCLSGKAICNKPLTASECGCMIDRAVLPCDDSMVLGAPPKRMRTISADPLECVPLTYLETLGDFQRSMFCAAHHEKRVARAVKDTIPLVAGSGESMDLQDLPDCLRRIHWAFVDMLNKQVELTNGTLRWGGQLHRVKYQIPGLPSAQQAELETWLGNVQERENN